MKNPHAPRLFSLLLVAAVAAAAPQAANGEHWWDNRPGNDFVYDGDWEPVNWFYYIANGGAVISWGEYADRSDSYTNPEDAPTQFSGAVPDSVPFWDCDMFGNPVEGDDYIPVIGIEDLCSVRDLLEGSGFSFPRTIRYLGDEALKDYTTDQVGFIVFVSGGENTEIEFDYLGYKPFMRDPYRQGNSVDVFENYVVDAFGTETTLDLSAYKGVAGGALEDYSPLLDVSLPATIGIIPKKLCNGCSGLGAIILPATVGEIESLAFGGCTSLTNIMFEGNAPTSVVATAFQGVNSNCIVTVQRGTAGWGEVPGTWQGMPIRYAGEEPPPALTGEYRDGNINWRFTVNADGSATIDSASAMVSLIYFNSENEGDYYFCWNGTIPSRVSDGVGEVNATWYPVTAIGDYALSGLAYDVGFPNGMSVFTITVPDAVTCIGDYAFQGISYATDIDLPEGLEYMGRNVFDGCNYITNGNSCDPDYAVQDLLAFEGWVVGPWWSCSTEGVERSAPGSADLSAAKGIAAGAFSNCTSLRSVVLPVNAGILPQSAFYGTSLTETLIPASVTNIEAGVFANCSSLTNITFAGNAPTSVDATAFQGVNSNCVVTVQRGTTGWGEVPGTWQGMSIRYAGEEPPPAPVVIDLSTLTGDYTASDGDVLTNSTTYVVTIPAGATVTINGMTVAGGAGSGATGPATFSADGDAITSRIAPGANGTWTLTAFAELASGSAEGLDDAQVKVYAANSLAGLASAEPMASGVVITNKVPAVKVELAVTPPDNSDAQFFRVGFDD